MRNPNGIINRPQKEWGRKARKDEARLRGARQRGRVDNITEQTAELLDPEVPLFSEPTPAEYAGLDHRSNPLEF